MKFTWQILRRYYTGISVLFGIVGMVALFFPISSYITSPKCKILAMFFLIIVGAIVEHCIISKRNIKIWKNGQKEISIKKGNILKSCGLFCARRKIVVIHVNNDFDMEVEDPKENSLISPTSLHGKWAVFFKRRYKKTTEELNEFIQKQICAQKIPQTLLDRGSKPRGNMTRCPKGSVISLKGNEEDKITFFLFALNEFDVHNHNKEMAPHEIRELFEKLISFCNENSQGLDIEIPIMATSHTKPAMTTVQAIEMMLAAIFNNIDKMKGKITIVITPECAKELENHLEG